MQIKTRTILYADDGKILTNNQGTYGRIICLAEDEDINSYYEITEEEYEAMFAIDKIW